MAMTFADILRAEEEAAQAKMPRALRWDARWMRVAQLISTFSKDPGHRVGAVLVDSNFQTLRGTGYNGYPRRVRDAELHNRAYKLERTVHAEVNCIVNARPIDLHWHSGTLYVSGLWPCAHCATVIIQTNIQRVVVSVDDGREDGPWKESASIAQNLFQEAGVVFDTI